MDTTSKLVMRLLTDLYSSDNEKITGTYQKYYDSLSNEQSKCQVQDAINKIIEESKGKITCDFGEYDFTMTSIG